MMNQPRGSLLTLSASEPQMAKRVLCVCRVLLHVTVSLCRHSYCTHSFIKCKPSLTQALFLLAGRDRPESRQVESKVLRGCWTQREGPLPGQAACSM